MCSWILIIPFVQGYLKNLYINHVLGCFFLWSPSVFVIFFLMQKPKKQSKGDSFFCKSFNVSLCRRPIIQQSLIWEMIQSWQMLRNPIFYPLSSGGQPADICFVPAHWVFLCDKYLDIKGWMAWNFPQLNENKFILVLLFGHGFCYTNHQKPQPSTYLTHFVKNLGVIFDSALKSDSQVKSIVNCSFFQLWIMSSVPSFIIATPFEKWNSPPFWIRSAVSRLKSQL